MAPKRSALQPARRVSVWFGLAVLIGWLLVQNTVLLIVVGSRLEWGRLVAQAGAVWRIVEVLVQTVGPQLMGGTLVAVAVLSAGVMLAARSGQREARHA